MVFAVTDPDRHRSSRLLVLDIGGVLLADPMPTLFQHLAEAGERPVAAVRGFYLANLREGLWSGEMAEDEFWSRILCAVGLSSREARQWREQLLAWQPPLPAAERLADWSAVARILLLSNHRSAWVRPALSAAGIPIPEPAVRTQVALSRPAPRPIASKLDSARPRWIERAMISEETGLVKPDRGAFAAVLAYAGSATPCLFVDDQRPNVDSAIASGLPAILADPEGAWIGEVEAWLGAEEAVAG